MTHPISLLQANIVPALRAAGLAIYDAAPAGVSAPYLVIARHMTSARDADDGPVTEHRLEIHAFAADASRKAALTLADTALEVLLGAAFAEGGLTVTYRQLLSTDTIIDSASGRARAALTLRLFTEPT